MTYSELPYLVAQCSYRLLKKKKSIFIPLMLVKIIKRDKKREKEIIKKE